MKLRTRLGFISVVYALVLSLFVLHLLKCKLQKKLEVKKCILQKSSAFLKKYKIKNIFNANEIKNVVSLAEFPFTKIHCGAIPC